MPSRSTSFTKYKERLCRRLSYFIDFKLLTTVLSFNKIMSNRKQLEKFNLQFVKDTMQAWSEVSVWRVKRMGPHGERRQRQHVWTTRHWRDCKTHVMNVMATRRTNTHPENKIVGQNHAIFSLKAQDPGGGRKIPAKWHGTGACHGFFIP